MQSTHEEQGNFAARFLAEVQETAQRLNVAAIEELAGALVQVRQRAGRLFVLGVGGSAANASHAVNDFRKLTGIETYAPTDNVSELTARVNDEGWATVFKAWLEVSRLQARDAVLVFSVGGGNAERNVSPNIVAALDYAKSVGATILGIVGRDGGYTARVADACVLIPKVNSDRITPHAEAFQGVIWHLLVSHPALQKTAAKWESIAPSGQHAAVFLDRDGVLNEAILRDGKPYPPKTPEEMKLTSGASKLLTRLKANGFLLLVVTNQPDVARGSQERELVEQMELRLRSQLPLDDVLTCYHDDEDNCDCRKPRPGLMLRAAQRYGIDLSRSYMIGDRWRDIDAGAKAGVRTVWIDQGYAERAPAAAPSARVQSLSEAVDWILQDAKEPA